MKILFGFSLLWLFASAAWSGNLPQLIALGQNAAKENIVKFNKESSFSKSKNRLNFSLDGRYVLEQNGGGYKTKAGSLTARLEYMLFDGGVSRARDKIAVYSDISRFYKNDESLNLTALQIGRIYFNAVAIDDIIKLKNELIKMLGPILDEAEFWTEFGDIDNDEFSLLNSISARFLSEVDELGFRRFELLTRINLLSDGEIDFIAGSRLKTPKFDPVPSDKTQANFQLNLTKSYSAIEERGKLMPKFYLKDTQEFDINSFKSDKRSGKELLSGYLAANRPTLEFSWNLPNASSSKERQVRRIDELKSAQELSDERILNAKRLNELKERIKALEARLIIDESRYLSAKDDLAKAISKYAQGEIDTDKTTLLIDAIFERSINFILNASELEILKMEWYFERGERLTDQIF